MLRRLLIAEGQLHQQAVAEGRTEQFEANGEIRIPIREYADGNCRCDGNQRCTRKLIAGGRFRRFYRRGFGLQHGFALSVG